MKFLSDILARAGLVVDGNVTLNSVANATTDTDKFLTIESSVVKFRTGAQLLSDIGGQPLLTNPITGTGTAGQVAFYTGTTAISGDSDLYWDNTNKRLGVGSTTPYTSVQIGSTSGAKYLGIVDTADTTYNIAYIGHNGTKLHIGFSNSNTSISERNAISINSADLYVGIGVSAPVNRLQIGSMGATGFSGNHLAFGNGAAATAFFQGSSSTQMYLSTYLAIMPSGSGTGNLVVGSLTNSGYRLDVVGTFRVTSTVTFDSIANAITNTDRFLVSDAGVLKYRTAAQLLSDIGGQAALTNPITGTGSSGRVAYWSGTSTQTGSNNFFWDAANNRLGVGTTNPQRVIEIFSSTADSHLRISGVAPSVSLGEANTGSIYQAKFGLATVSGHYASAAVPGDFVIISQTASILWVTNTTEKMRVNNSGNVSIGNTNDTYKLDVSGEGRFTSNLSVNGLGDFNTTSSSTYDFAIRNSGTGNTRLRFGNSTSVARLTITLGPTGSEFARFGPEGPFPLHFQTNGSDRLSFDGSTGAATFSSTITSKDITITESGSGQLTIQRQNIGFGAVVNFNTTSTNRWFMGLRGLSNDNFYIYNQTAGANNLILDASTGAATFSSSVGVGGYGAGYSNLESSSGTFGSTVSLISLAIKDGTYNPRSTISYRTQTGSAYAVIFDSGYSSGWAATNWCFNSGNVGIGTTSPVAILQTQQTSAGSEVTGLLIQNVGSSANTAVSLNFAPHENTSSPTTLAKISAVRTALNNAPTDLVFHTFNSTLQERMRITSGGQLRLNTYTSASAWTGTAVATLGVDSSGNVITVTGGGGSSQWTTSGSDIFYSTGRVAIGTSTFASNRTLIISRASETATGQLELRNVGGISDGFFDGIYFTQSSDGSTPLGSIRLVNKSNGYPDIAFYTRSGGLTESVKVTILNNGNFGIGTTSPAQRLDVRGYIVSDSQSNGSESAFYLGNSSHGLSRANLQNDIVLYTTAGDVRLSASTASTTHLIVKNSGNVGIGTATPGYKLDVYTAGATSAIRINADANQNSQLRLEEASSVKFAITYVPADDSTRFFHNTTDLVTFDANGRVGIGTTSPQDRLDVNGSIRFRANTPNFTAVLDNAVLDFVPTSIFPTTPCIRLAAIGTASVGAEIRFLTGTSTSLSTRLTIAADGAATFTSSVTAAGNFTTTADGGTGGLRLTLNNTGVNQIQYAFVSGGIAGDGNFAIRNGSVGSNLLIMTQTGATTFTSTVNAKSASTAAALGGFSVMGAGEFMSTGSLAGYFFENRSGGTVTSSSNWYGWYATSAIVRLYNGSTDLISINGATGATTFTSSITCTSLTETSTIKVKENIVSIDSALDQVEKLQAVSYNRKGSSVKEIGLIAEAVEEVYPEFVQYDQNGEPVGLNYSRLTAVLIESVKELKNRIQELEKRN